MTVNPDKILLHQVLQVEAGHLWEVFKNVIAISQQQNIWSSFWTLLTKKSVMELN